MTAQVKLKNSSVGGKVPLTTDLVYGELALNYADGKQYYKTSGNAIDTFASINATATLSNKTLSSPTISGALTIGGTSGASGQVLQSTGTGVQWGAIALSVADDTTTDATKYILWGNNTTGTNSSTGVSSSKLYFNPSTGTLSATHVNSLSDISFKKNIAPITNAIETINRLEGVEFDWKDTNKRSYGVIAQELEAILPELVETNDQGVKSVNYSGLIGFLINSIKEMDHRIKQLENQ